MTAITPRVWLRIANRTISESISVKRSHPAGCGIFSTGSPASVGTTVSGASTGVQRLSADETSAIGFSAATACASVTTRVHDGNSKATVAAPITVSTFIPVIQKT